jgi:hypothetical protein
MTAPRIAAYSLEPVDRKSMVSPLLQPHLLRRLVFPNPFERCLTQQLVSRPAPELPLDDEPALDPEGALRVLAGYALEVGGRLGAELRQAAEQLGEVFTVEPVPSLPAETSLRALPSARSA